VQQVGFGYSNIYPTRCNVTQFIFSANCSTCFGWYHHPLSGAAIAAGSSNGVTNTRCCKYSCLRSWWWVVVPAETRGAVSRKKINCASLHLVGHMYIRIFLQCTDPWTLKKLIQTYSDLYKTKPEEGRIVLQKDVPFSRRTYRFPEGRPVLLKDVPFSRRTYFSLEGRTVLQKDVRFPRRTYHSPEGRTVFQKDVTFSWRTYRSPEWRAVLQNDVPFSRRTYFSPEGRNVLQTCSDEHNILRHTVFVGYWNVRGWFWLGKCGKHREMVNAFTIWCLSALWKCLLEIQRGGGINRDESSRDGKMLVSAF